MTAVHPLPAAATAAAVGSAAAGGVARARSGGVADGAGVDDPAVGGVVVYRGVVGVLVEAGVVGVLRSDIQGFSCVPLSTV